MCADFNYFGTLQEKLVSEGFEREKIVQIYKSPQVFFDTKGVSLFFVHREAGLNYSQFPSTLSVVGARIYMKTYEKELLEAEEKYGVERSVITAIILVETKFGQSLGKRQVINTLSTMASLLDANVRNRFWEEISGSTTLSLDAFEKKALDKSNWAYRELKALLRYTEREEIDIFKITGSYAGALGIPQFMPSNIIRYATDGNMDGRIDLFEHADAIASIANFLKKCGWYRGIDDEKAKKVIRQYNPSSYYIDTILQVAQMLK
ncbi:MAG: lytic murein transglycosylase [Desulfobacterales bacterium]|nr:lytic murein transglycosylase [Desulfobacterales bacterium]